MDIRKPCALARLYEGPHHPIDYTAPEVRFMQAVCAGDIAAAQSFFSDTKLFGNAKSAIDAPYGRFEGLQGIAAFVTDWLPRFHAQAARLRPVIHTRAGGRAVCESVIEFEVDGAIEQVPMFVVADLRAADMLDEIRLYCHYSFVPGLQAYRAPIFNAGHLEMGDPGLLTGAVREYYEALHHSPSVDVERIMGCISPKCIFGGYDAWHRQAEAGEGYEHVRKAYEHMATYIPRCVAMRYETLIDDGRTGIIEWVHVISRAGQEERGRIAMSGIAAYERGDDGLLCSIRISDYAGSEGTIAWDTLPVTKAEAQAVNLVEEFPVGVGRKGQY